jgi:hypothetical protein
MRTRATTAALILSVLGLWAGAQPAPAPAPAPDAPRRLEDLPPPVRLGARVGVVRQRLGAIPAVVIVPDGASYVRAVGGWTLEARYPVLIDDGTWNARENIARFVRAFEPTDVVRWSAGADAGGLAGDEPGRRAEIESAVARAWGAGSPGELRAAWEKVEFVPPGVVAARAMDPAWTAALALAAGHGQPIVWIDPTGDLNAAMSGPDARALMETVRAGAEGSGYPWKGVGEGIDAVTLCVNGPSKASYPKPDPREMIALTDLVGRDGDQTTSERWAWSGQIIGTESEAAYQAMSSLFLSGPGSAWVFDGYDDGPPWNAFDATRAATILEKAGIPTKVFDGGRQSAMDFRRATVGRDATAKSDAGPVGMGVDAGLIAVNTSGNEDFFDLKPGQCRPGDVPALRRPAVVYFVHSWSAKFPGHRWTIFGRWRERGVYAYVGSVHEPYLQAFVPTPALAARTLSGFPLGAGARLDRGEPWKIAIFGDPLLVFTQPIPRRDAKVPLEGAVSVEDGLREALQGKRFAEALEKLRALGRDRDAARLLAAVIKDSPDALTPDVALAGISAAFFRGDDATFAKAYAAARHKIEDTSSGLGTVQDMLWQASYPQNTALSPERASWLGTSLRPESYARDAGEAFRAIQTASGDAAGREFLREARKNAPNDAVRAELNKIVP